jgi:hypothetical protein
MPGYTVIYEGHDFPVDSQGSSIRGSHILGHSCRDLSFGQDEHLPVELDTEGKHSSKTRPTQVATRGPNYDRDSIIDIAIQYDIQLTSSGSSA